MVMCTCETPMTVVALLYVLSIRRPGTRGICSGVGSPFELDSGRLLQFEQLRLSSLRHDVRPCRGAWYIDIVRYLG